MSETVMYKGKIKKIPTVNNSLEETCKVMIFELGMDDINYDRFEDYAEYLCEEKYLEYIVINNELYQVLSKMDCECDDTFESKENNDGTIDYLVRYYNGCMCFEEAIETALGKNSNKMENNDRTEVEKIVLGDLINSMKESND